MSTLKVQRNVNAVHHEATCRMLVEAVSQEAVNAGRIKGVLREASVIMKDPVTCCSHLVRRGWLAVLRRKPTVDKSCQG